ncbi:MAG: methyltransferase domain-containing protein [Candidatus Omnitrophota bacterium]
MIARKVYDSKFARWNNKWHAPYGRLLVKRFLPKKYFTLPAFCNLVGMFSFQPNNSTRCFEYPWAFYAADIQKGMHVVDLGGGYSGFPLMLSKIGCHTVNVDPMKDYSDFKHYQGDHERQYQRLNALFGTQVVLKQCTLQESGIRSLSVDRIFCLSVIEHLDEAARLEVMKECFRILKPEGRMILTIDLFLDLFPFTTRRSNQLGENISIKKLLGGTGFKIEEGVMNELYGFETFNVDSIQSNLGEYLIGESYPTLVQAFVLKKI